jgi:hypothetical protein
VQEHQELTGSASETMEEAGDDDQDDGEPRPELGKMGSMPSI